MISYENTLYTLTSPSNFGPHSCIAYVKKRSMVHLLPLHFLFFGQWFSDILLLLGAKKIGIRVKWLKNSFMDKWKLDD